MNETGMVIALCTAFGGWCFVLEQRLAKKLDRATFDAVQRAERARLDQEAKEDRDKLERHLESIRDKIDEKERVSNEFKEHIRDELHALNLKLQTVLSRTQGA